MDSNHLSYLNLAKREALKELASEIEARYFAFFRKHPEIDATRESTDKLVMKYWRVVEIDNSLIGKVWSDSELEEVTEEMKVLLKEAKELLA